MGMADPRPDLVTAPLPLHRCNDGELTCFLCNRPHCEHEVRWHGDGRRVTIGVHRACADMLVSKADTRSQGTCDVITFKECASCAAKPGSPSLCAACLHNRATINQLRAECEALTKIYVIAARLRTFPVPFDDHFQEEETMTRVEFKLAIAQQR